MKLAVVGSRSFTNYRLMEAVLSTIGGITLIISGGARGADQLAEKYALENRIPTLIFNPEYGRHKKNAPLIRNIKIVDHADEVLAFWDGKSRGTKFTIDEARNREKSVRVVQV